MKKALYTIAVLSVGFGLILSGSAQATAPKAGDIPDIRALNGAALSSVLDLDDYVADFDDYSFLADTDLDWTNSTGPTGSAPTFSLDGNNLLSLDAAVVGDLGSYDWVVEDASGQQAVDSSAYKASSAIGLYPAVSYDALLSPVAGQAVYTYVLDAPSVTGAVTTQVTSTVVISGSGTPAWDATYINAAYDASLNGAYSPRNTLASGTGVVTVSGLDAAISSSGEFELTSTGSGLSDPVIVGFRGDVTSGGDYAAVSVLVSNALLSVNRGLSPEAPGLDVDDGFETDSVGEIARVGFQALGNPPNRREGAAQNQWVNNVNLGNSLSGSNGYVSAVVIAESALPTSLQDSDFEGDHSGQVLRVALEGSGGANGAYIQRNAPVPAQAGYAYAVEASIATNAATLNDVPNIILAINTFGAQELSAQLHGAVGPGADGSAPILSEGWLKIRAYLEPSATGLADLTPNGLTATFVLTNPATNPVEVYIDNVSIYKTILPNDASFGAARVSYTGRPDVMIGDRVRPYIDPTVSVIGGNLLDGSFESGTGAIGPNSSTSNGNANGWFHTGASLPSGVTASVGSSQLATQLEAGDANWLTVNFNAPAAAAAPQIRTRLLDTDGAGAAFTPGVYVMSVDYFTPSGSNNPATVMGVSDNGFTNYAYTTLGTGTNGAVRRVRVPVALRDVDNIVYLFVPTASAGQTVSASFDNVMLEKVDDALSYWDESLVN